MGATALVDKGIYKRPDMQRKQGATCGIYYAVYIIIYIFNIVNNRLCVICVEVALCARPPATCLI